MILPTYERAALIASRLKVLDQKTGQLVPLRFNAEQTLIMRAALTTSRLIVGKGRQVGCTTILAFLMLLVVVLNPGVPCAIVADEQRKAEAVLQKIKSWLAQLGVGLTKDDVRRVVLVNGASIDALSAISTAEEGESRVGRLQSYGVVHATEQSFWRNARAVFAALTSTLLSGGLIWNESTGSPGEGLFRALFEGEGWKRLFFGVEQHENYRLDEGAIDDATWEHLRLTHGFTRRDSAAWWHHKLTTDFGNNLFAMLREYPVIPAHMFTFREGLHIQAFRQVQVIERDEWNLYAEPKEEGGLWSFGEPVIVGIDTSAGRGGDASALAVIGHRTGNVLATWRSNTTTIPDFITFLGATLDRLTPAAFVIESNGVGQVVWQALCGRLSAQEQVSGDHDGEVVLRRDTLRAAIESKKIAIGGHLAQEAQASTVKLRGESRRVVFEGADDVLSALSFAWKWRTENPWRMTEEERDPTKFYIDRRLKKRRAATW